MSSEELVSQINEDTFLVTSLKKEEVYLQQAVDKYVDNTQIRSTYFNENSGTINFKIDDIDMLALNAQTNLNNIIKINNIVRFFVNKNDILGKVYEALETNINSDWSLTYPKYKDEEKEIYDEVDQLIKDFNDKINLNKLIIDSIPMSYLEGNYAMYLKRDGTTEDYKVDYYPLGVYEVADHSVNDDPYLLINVQELRKRLAKIYKKNKKSKPLFYKDMDDEVKDIYPEEVFKAFKGSESHAVLEHKNTGIIRTNNLKRKYGLTPLFKSLKSIIRLENIELADDKNTLVRAKKIIFQKLSKELITTPPSQLGNLTWSAAQAKAHIDLMAALKGNGISVYTGLPWTESVTYVENKTEPTNVQVKKQYRDEIMTSVGISYLSTDKGAFGAAQISIGEMLKVINKIAIQLSDILQKWYKHLLIDNGIDPKYCPKIKVMNSEKLNLELSMQLSRVLNTEINASLESTYATLGLDIHTEARRRKQEKEAGYDEIFTPRLTAFTNNGSNGNNDEGGRPANSKNTDQQIYNKEHHNENG